MGWMQTFLQVKTDGKIMPNWSEIVARHHEGCHRNDGSKLVTGLPATDAELNTLSVSLGIQLPNEFCDLYRTFDGFGTSHESDSKTCWLFHPLNQVEAFAVSVRKWFIATHEEYAKRFFPLIDFSNGDGIGYLTDRSNTVMDGLFCFEHEKYRFKETQDVNDFISHAPVSIERFLMHV
jgi:SMI1/KNR4 family protein SUKH-1